MSPYVWSSTPLTAPIALPCANITLWASWIMIKHWSWHVRPRTTHYLNLGKPRLMTSREGTKKHSKSSLQCIRSLTRLGLSLWKLSRIMCISWGPTTNHTINRMVSRKSATFLPLGNPRSNFLKRYHILDPQTHHKLWSTKSSTSVAILMMAFH